PKQDWLNFVVTGKARSKIRQTLNEAANRNAELAKEMLQRRFKNRKLELEEPVLMRTIKRLGYKTVTEFYSAIAAEKLDIEEVISEYDATVRRTETAAETRSAGEFILDAKSDADSDTGGSSDILIIGGKNLKGINYKLAKCCNPIYGDTVTGFISSEGVVKVHRSDCQNAMHLAERYPYRIITTRWAGEGCDVQFGATLRVIGHDDIGIVTNITSMISKEKGVLLRNISIDAHDGIFQGYLVVGVNDTRTLNNLIKKIKTVKGVKDVQRNN
ncbi:MAG: RelA/SpoT family protein, partial [Candidatus Amulumruptor sp.]